MLNYQLSFSMSEYTYYETVRTTHGQKYSIESEKDLLNISLVQYLCNINLYLHAQFCLIINLSKKLENVGTVIYK